jgi:hypothetical protein
MTFNESIVEEATLAMPMAALFPPLPRGEETREAIRRLSPAIPEEASACASHADRRAVIKRYLKARFVRRLNP